MNLNDENIDQLFRKSAENVKAPEYSDAYWAEMNQMIDAEEKNRKRLMIWTFFGTIGAALVALLLFFNNETTNLNSSYQISENSNPAQNEASDAITNHSSASADFSQKKIDPNQDLTSIDGNSKTLNKIEVEKYSPKIDKKASKTNKTFNLSSNNSNKTEGFDKVINQKTKNNSKKVLVNAKNKTFISTESNIAIQKLPAKLIGFETSSETEENLIPPKNISNQLHVSYHAEAAFGVSESYQNNTTSPWRFSVSGLARLEYGQLVVNTGIGVQVESPANLQVTERAKVYGFGLKNYENTLNYKSFTQVFIPLEVGFKSNNSTFGVGGQFHSIVGTRMSLTSKVNQEITAKKDFNNQMAGLNRFSGNFYLFIDQQLTDKISAGVRVGSAIGSRIADSHYFNSVTNDQPIFGQITLKYQLFK